jgi:translation initiation factor 3 subunit B
MERGGERENRGREAALLSFFFPSFSYGIICGNLVVKRISILNVKSLFPFSIFPQATGTAGGQAMLWPLFKWAGGQGRDEYFAKLAPNGNALNVYQAPDMGLLDKKSIRLENVQDFAWSPAGPLLAAYQAEIGNNLPARIVLMKIPEREEVRMKNLFSVAEVRLHWHPEGDYLAVAVSQFTKTKKSTFTTFQIFR